ncbi:MAG: M20/M25/M40 family metallo-hydrolase [Isosphaeraceae bacterium]
MRRPLRSLAILAVATAVPALALRAQQAAAPAQPARPAEAPASTSSNDMVDRIKEEESRHSQVMATLSHLTDVIGPRLTGSPNMKRANEWTRDRLTAWGLKNAHLEAWGPFGRGWTLKRFSAQVIEPQCIPLIAYPKAWSPGTDGTLVAPVVYFNPKDEADFARYKGKIKGAIVLAAAPRDIPAHFESLGARKTDSELLTLADADDPQPRGFGRQRAGGPQAKGQPPANAPRPGRFQMTDERRRQFELAAKKLKFLADEGAAMIVDGSRAGDGGTIFVQSASVPGVMPNFLRGQGQGQAAQQRRVNVYDKDCPKIPPQIVVSQEQYNRLVRMIEQGERPKMVVDLSVQFHDEDLMGYNTVAEIPGTDPRLKDEVVMLGGHMDSWHSGTGATDNAAGVSVAMEVMRIIQALNLKPRRTIRIALWSGEEEGLLGSRAYVTQHFGRSPANMFGGGPAGPANNGSSTDTAPKPEYEKFQAYFNLDNGTGKIRGVYLQGNEAARPIFRKWLQPFRDMGASTITIANTGGTDHQSFDGIGLPGFQFIQDEIEYETRTHHSNQDVFDRIQADDMKQAATIMATFVYNAAMMDEKVPRKPAQSGSPSRRGIVSN